MSKEYTLSYLPLFELDLAAARDYIASALQNPVAARQLVEEAEEAIVNRLANPLAFVNHTILPRKGNTLITAFVLRTIQCFTW